MKQGRPDVVRELVKELRKDEHISRIEVVRTNKTLAYHDMTTVDAVAAAMDRPGWADHMAQHESMRDAAKTAATEAIPKLKAQAGGDVAPILFAYDDAAWRAVLQRKEPLAAVEEVDGVPYLTVLEPIRNGAVCQTCHGDVLSAAEAGAGGGAVSGYGDNPRYGQTGAGAPYDPRNQVRAVLVVRRSQAALEAQISENTRSTLLVAAGTAGGFILLLFVFVRLFGVRLRPQRYGNSR